MKCYVLSCCNQGELITTTIGSIYYCNTNVQYIYVYMYLSTIIVYILIICLLTFPYLFDMNRYEQAVLS